MDARLIAEPFKRVDELVEERHVAERLAERLAAAHGVHRFHLRVPALDAVVEIESEDADVDGFDDVFVEFLQPFELGDLFFQARIEAGILQRDADVAGERFEQFDVFAGEEVAADGAAQADYGNGARRWSVLHAAGQIVVQVEQRCGLLLVRRQMQGLLRILEEDVASDRAARSKSRKPSARLRLCVAAESKPCDAARRSPPRSSAQERRQRARPAGCAAAARRSKSSRASRSVSELSPRPNSISALR